MLHQRVTSKFPTLERPMKRSERRRAEAHQRSYEARLRKDAAEKFSGLPQDIKDDIAAVVRAVSYTTGGGTCMFRAFTGGMALQAAGIEADRVVGGMLYRVGPDPMRDVVAFYSPGNFGCIRDGRFLGHSWLRVGDDLVDFSVGDWRKENELLGTAHRRRAGRAATWTIEPPDYFWAPWADFMPPVPAVIAGKIGKIWTPDIGRAVYPGFNGSDADRRQLAEPNDTMMELLQLALPAIIEQAKRFELRQRVDAWQKTQQ